MSTIRRSLGTGPSTTRGTSTTTTAARLLPVERVEPGQLLGNPEQREGIEQQGRRSLGVGIERAT
ncbi:hypothetical protein [Streptomyces zaomyceticus]|uniref:hypothetical protein n=1 Tax=Streptomyces zaomyceticus TaxID=68286 RepID=UPI0037A5A2E7